MSLHYHNIQGQKVLFFFIVYHKVVISTMQCTLQQYKIPCWQIPFVLTCFSLCCYCCCFFPNSKMQRKEIENKAELNWVLILGFHFFQLLPLIWTGKAHWLVHFCVTLRCVASLCLPIKINWAGVSAGTQQQKRSLLTAQFYTSSKCLLATSAF